MLQDDIFKTCYAPKPALSADEWISGVDKDPVLYEYTRDGLVELPPAKCQVVRVCVCVCVCVFFNIIFLPYVVFVCFVGYFNSILCFLVVVCLGSTQNCESSTQTICICTQTYFQCGYMFLQVLCTHTKPRGFTVGT